jgi:hypothetical protein
MLTHSSAGDKIEKNEIGGTYRVFRGEERRIQGCGRETLEKETTGENQA